MLRTSLYLCASATLALTFAAPAAQAQFPPCDNCGGGTIEGTVFEDLAPFNGVFDGAEAGLANVDVTLMNGEGQVAGVVTTGIGGAYSFSGLDCGTWVVMIDIPGGYTQTAPPLYNGFWFVLLNTDNQVASGRDFALETSASCNGGPFLDVIHTGWDEDTQTTLTGPDDDWILTSVQPTEGTCIDANGLPANGPHQINLPPLASPLHGGHPAWEDPLIPPGGSATNRSSYVSYYPQVGTPNGAHFYQHCFCLSTETPTNFEIEMDYLADDLAEVWLNGNLLFADTNNLPNHFDNGSPNLPLQVDNATSNFDPAWLRRGMNCLTMRVDNTGRFVTAFDVVGTITADDGLCCQDLHSDVGQISGAKRLDINGNGVVDPTDPPIAGWTSIQLQDTSGTVLQSTSTDANGKFQFSALNYMSYEVHETLPNSNWTQTAPTNPDHFDVTIDANTPNQGGLTFLNAGPICELAQLEIQAMSGEPAQECCFSILAHNQLVDYFQGVQVDPVGGTAVFNENASPGYSYYFSGGNGITYYADPGPYMAPGSPVQVGEFCLAGTSSVPGPHLNVGFMAGGIFCDIDLSCGNSITGHKWNDEDADGLNAAWEAELAGWTIELIDASTGAVVATTTTDANGYYAFTGLPFGDYIVQEIQQTGWTQTWPAAPGTHSFSFDPDDGIQSVSADFGNQAINTTGGGGTPTDDCVEIQDEQIACIDALSWTYTFDMTNLSDFDISEVVLQGFDPAGTLASPNPNTLAPALGQGDTTQMSFTLSGGVPGETVCFYVTVHSEQQLECCSVETCVELPGCSDCVNAIHGVKFHDRNGNGIRNNNDEGLAGWTINLEYPNGTVVSTTTDQWGNYWFTGLPHGVYEVYETQQNGWIQTFPSTPTHTVTLAALGGEVAQNIDFGNDKTTVTTDPGDPTGLGSGTADGATPPDPADPADPSGAIELVMSSAGGATDVTFVSFSQAAPEDEDALVRSVTLAASGSAAELLDVTELRLVWDVDADGVADADEPVLARGAFAPGEQRATLTIADGHTIDAASSHAFVVVGDVVPSGRASFGVGVHTAPGPGSTPWLLWLFSGLALLLGALALRATRRRSVFAGLLAAGALWMGGCAAEVATEPVQTYQLFLMQVDAVGADSGVSLTATQGPEAGPLYRISE